MDNFWCCFACDLLRLTGLIFVACESLGSCRRSKFGDAIVTLIKSSTLPSFNVVSPVISDLEISCSLSVVDWSMYLIFTDADLSAFLLRTYVIIYTLSFSTMLTTPSLPYYGPQLLELNYLLPFLSSCNSLLLTTNLFIASPSWSCLLLLLHCSFPSFRLENLLGHTEF